MRCRKQIIADLDVTYIIDFLIANNVVDNQAQEAINSMVRRLFFNSDVKKWQGYKLKIETHVENVICIFFKVDNGRQNTTIARNTSKSRLASIHIICRIFARRL